MFKYDSDQFMSNLYEGVYIVNKKRQIVFWNKGSEYITGYQSDEVVNSFCYQNILQHIDKTGKRLCLEGCPLQHTLMTGKINENEVFLHHKDGHRVPVSVKTMPLYDESGNITAAVEVFTDMNFRTFLHEENTELKKLLEIDSLTGIYNRRYLQFYINHRFLEKKEFAIPFAILFIDIDNFKQINDNFGHVSGDGVLKTISKTIDSNIRSGDVFGRWGGEEFIIVFRKVSIEDLHSIAEKLRIAVKNSVYKVNDEVEIGASISIGGCLSEENDSLETLVKRADELMYMSKNAGKDRVTIK